VSEFTHLDAGGRARMVDVSGKDVTDRVAVARGAIVMQPETLARIVGGALPKGDVLAAARLAGIMAAKRTADLIPLCHPLPLAAVEIDLTPDPGGTCIEVAATVRTSGRTGVEMEALTAASIAALTVYDMCKALSHTIVIQEIKLMEKSGGKKDFKRT